MRVAGGNQGVVHAARGVLDQREDRAPPVGDEGVAHGRRELEEPGAAGLHRHPLRRVARAEAPGVDHLRPVSVHDADALAGRDVRRLAAPRRNGHERGHRGLPSGAPVRSIVRLPATRASVSAPAAVSIIRRRARPRRLAPPAGAGRRRRAAAAGRDAAVPAACYTRGRRLTGAPAAPAGRVRAGRRRRRRTGGAGPCAGRPRARRSRRPPRIDVNQHDAAHGGQRDVGCPLAKREGGDDGRGHALRPDRAGRRGVPRRAHRVGRARVRAAGPAPRRPRAGRSTT